MNLAKNLRKYFRRRFRVLAKKQLREMINLADVIKLNDDEIKFIFEEEDIDKG